MTQRHIPEDSHTNSGCFHWISFAFMHWSLHQMVLDQNVEGKHSLHETVVCTLEFPTLQL